MARIKKERKGKERKGKATIKTHKSVIFHTRVANNAIITKFGIVVDLTYIIFYAKFGCNRLKGEHSAAVHNLPFPITSMVGLTAGKH